MNAEGAGLVTWNVGLEILRIWTQAEIVSVAMPIPSHLLIYSLGKKNAVSQYGTLLSTRSFPVSEQYTE